MGITPYPTPENVLRGVGPGAPDMGTHSTAGSGPHGYGAGGFTPKGKRATGINEAVRARYQSGGGASASSIETAPVVGDSVSVPTSKRRWGWALWLSAGIVIGLAAPPATRWAYGKVKSKMGGS